MTYELVLSDVDSTLIDEEVIDEIANRYGVGAQVSEITARAMNGELDFVEALKARVSLLQGADASILEEVARSIHLSPGADELITFCSSADIPFGIVSGGFIEVLEIIGLTDRVDFFRANSLEIIDQKLSGRLLGSIIDRNAKAVALQDFAREAGVDLHRTVAIGDGANDLEMVRLAGLGVAFRGKPRLREAADLVLGESLAELIPYLQS